MLVRNISRILAAIATLLLIHPAAAQLNMVLQGNIQYPTGVNDVCGWDDGAGREYALVGLNTGVSIVDITDDTLREVAFVPGVNNIWRDINTYGHYAYVSSEARVGLLIIDLQYLPDSVQTYVWADSLPTSNGPRAFEKAHTLWIDEHGICYLNGSNVNGGGPVLIDVKTNPTDPIFLGYAPAIYSHDVYARDSILYSAEIYGGNLSIYDVHDPTNITLLGRVKTPNEFTHNAWLSDDSQYMFTTDERANSYVAAYDISDPANIVEVDRYRQPATDGTGAIPHNVYVWNDWLVVAYYTNGTTIVDAARPDNLIEVGEFDSYFGPHGGFDGVWGSWPFLPSGKILTSDRNSGLYVFYPNYVRACYLEGSVIDSVTRQPIFNARVEILDEEIVLPEFTRPDGSFKTGKAIPGTFDVRVEKTGYYPKTITLAFVNGELLEPEIELVALPTYTLSGSVIDPAGTPVPFAAVSAFGTNGVYNINADGAGNFFLHPVYTGFYDVQGGIWGMTGETTVNLSSNQEITIQAMPGYRDDFDLELGWSVTGDAASGRWGRGLPNAQSLFNTWTCGSDGDSPFDTGAYAYSTGLMGGDDVTDDEVSGGATILTSPEMDFSTYLDPRIEFDYWLCEFPPNQFHGVSAHLTNGVDTMLLGELRNDTIAGSWQTQVYENLPLTGPLDQMQFILIASDTTPGANDYILKMHLDNFRVIDETLSSGDPQVTDGAVRIFPNPGDGRLVFLRPDTSLEGQELTVRILDARGMEVFRQVATAGGADIALRPALAQGYYQIVWHTDSGAAGSRAWVVIRG